MDTQQSKGVNCSNLNLYHAKGNCVTTNSLGCNNLEDVHVFPRAWSANLSPYQRRDSAKRPRMDGTRFQFWAMVANQTNVTRRGVFVVAGSKNISSC
jgi:hypothetical protein